jgi:hypothetical protein
MERLSLNRLTSFFFEPLAPELVEWQGKVLRGEVPELWVGGRLIIDQYGITMRIRTPWADNGLEKSYIARVDKDTREVTLELEGFFLSDKKDWPE